MQTRAKLLFSYDTVVCGRQAKVKRFSTPERLETVNHVRYTTKHFLAVDTTMYEEPWTPAYKPVVVDPNDCEE